MICSTNKCSEAVPSELTYVWYPDLTWRATNPVTTISLHHQASGRHTSVITKEEHHGFHHFHASHRSLLYLLWRTYGCTVLLQCRINALLSQPHPALIPHSINHVIARQLQRNRFRHIPLHRKRGHTRQHTPGSCGCKPFAPPPIATAALSLPQPWVPPTQWIPQHICNPFVESTASPATLQPAQSNASGTISALIGKPRQPLSPPVAQT